MKYKNRAFLLVPALMLAVCSRVYAIDWQSDYEAGLKQADHDGKPVMMDFYTDHCGWCKKLDRDVYSKQEVNDLSGKYVCLKINGQYQPKITRLYDVRGFPTVIFLNKDGEEIDRLVGYYAAVKIADVMTRHLDGREAGKPRVKIDEPAAAQAPAEKTAPESPPLVEKTADTAPVEKKEGFWLSGIMADDRGALAILNDVVVKAGDTVAGAKVLSIGKDEVRLLVEGKEIVVKS